jgi:hypothetical protein
VAAFPNTVRSDEPGKPFQSVCHDRHAEQEQAYAAQN